MGDFFHGDRDAESEQSQASLYHTPGPGGGTADVGTFKTTQKDLNDVDVSGSVASGAVDVGDNLIIDAAVGTPWAQVYDNEDGGGVGLGANLAEINTTYHDDERTAKLGLSAGVGGGARYHTSDDDHDGKRELGFGVSVGPVSIDYKTETPAQDLVSPLSDMAEVVGLDTTFGTEYVDDAIQGMWNDEEENRAAQRELEWREQLREIDDYRSKPHDAPNNRHCQDTPLM